MSVKTKITVDNSELQQGMQQAENIVNRSGQKMQNGLNGASSGMQKLGQAAQAASQAATGGFNGMTSALAKIGPVGMIAAAAIGAIGIAAKKAWDFISGMNGRVDAMAKAAKSVGISADAYLGIEYAAKSAGIEAQKVLNIITRLDQAVSHAAEGNKKYIDAFAQLGIYWRDLENVSPEQRFIKIIEQVRKFKEEGKNLPSGLSDLVGRRDLQTVNKAVADGFDKNFVEAAMKGFGMDPKTFQNAEAFQTALGAMNQRLLASVVQLKAFVEATQWLTKHMGEMFKNSKADVSPELREAYISFGEAAADNIDKLNDQQLKTLAKMLLPNSTRP